MPLVTYGDYEVEACRGRDVVTAGVDISEAQFYGVYFRTPPDPNFENHRFAEHIADFNKLSEAAEYAEFKNRGKK